LAAAMRCSATVHGSDVGPNHRATFAHLSRTIHRGFKFDRIFVTDGPDPQSILNLDQMALCSLKTLDLPAQIEDKVIKLLRDFGQKKGLERYGKYMNKKIRTRTSAEVPRMLPSLFLPEHDHQDDGPIGRLKRNPAFKDLFEHADVTSLSDSTLGRLAIANMEDRRNKLFQMFWSPEAALTYVAHRYAATWVSNFRVMHELARRAPDFRPSRVLDYGAGPAPSLAAAQEVWHDCFEFAAAIEPSEHMTQIGKYLTEGLRLPPVEWQRCLYDATDKYDFIIASYVQMEVRGQPSRDALIKQLWNRLSAGGVLLLIEPGTPTGFRFMHHTRELLISRIGAENFHFVAPCPHEGMCPLALTGRDWCHFAQRVKRVPHRVYCKGSRKRFLEEEKFSYLCVRKSQGPRMRYYSEAHAPTPHEKSYFWPRIMFPVIKAGQHTHVDVCSAPQNFERLTVSKSKSHTFGYRSARKSMWGDLWRFPKRLSRPEARLYIPSETRSHLDRLAKKAWKALKWEDADSRFAEDTERDEQFYGH